MTMSLKSDVVTSKTRVYTLNEMDSAILWQVERNVLPGTANSSEFTQHQLTRKIRALEKRNLVQTLPLINMEACGQGLAHYFIRVSERSVTEVAKELASLCSTLVVAGLDKRCHLLVTARISDDNSAHQVLEELSEIPGIVTVSSELVLRPVLNHISHVRLAGPRHINVLNEQQSELSGGVAKVMDEIDLGIIKRLQDGGRVSKRTIAKDLGVSEGAIRYRIKKLEEKNLLKFVLTFDPRVLGLNHWAWLQLEVDPSMQNDVLSALQDCYWTKYLAVTTGAKSLACLALTESKAELDAVIANEVGRMPGVRDLTVSRINANYKIDKRWGSF